MNGATVRTILHTEESNGWGGQEIRILSEMVWMKARGHEVLLATPGHTAIFGRAKKAGIETFDVGMTRGEMAGGVASLIKIIRSRRVEIINTHSSRDSWMGSLAGRLARIKVIRTRHISSKLNTGPFTKLVYGPLTDAVMTTGTFIKNQLISELNLDPSKIYSIPTGIDIGKYHNADGSSVRIELGIGSGPVIGVAAALRSWKGHEYIVRAMPAVLKKFPDLKLIFAGEGPLRYNIQNLIRELGLDGKVFMLGHREDVPRIIAAFDLSVLASFASEGIPQFVLQSMAAGKPVISTTVGGIPEVVEDGVNGILVPPKDPMAIASAVLAILSDPEKAVRMGQAGYEICVKGHSAGVMLDQIENLYGKLLS